MTLEILNLIRLLSLKIRKKNFQKCEFFEIHCDMKSVAYVLHSGFIYCILEQKITFHAQIRNAYKIAE